MEPSWLLAVDLLLNIAVEECIGYVQLVCRPCMSADQGQDSANRGRLHHRRERLGEVDAGERSTFLNPFATTSPASSISSASTAMAASSASSSDNEYDDAAPPQPAAASVIQTVNIRNHIPVVLDYATANYSQWRCCFDSVLGKFGLEDHVRSPTPTAQRNSEWRQIDSCLVNWIYTTIATNVFDLVHKPHITAFTLWSDVEGHFRDNELERAVLLEAEFRSVQQGDLSIHDYCTKLKRLADELHNVGHPVSEPSRVLNLLRGLNPKFRHLKPVIKSKSPPHNFRSAMSYLLLEEASDSQEAKTDAAQAYAARQDTSSAGGSSAAAGGSSGASAGGSAGGSGGSNGTSGGSGGNRSRTKKKGRGYGYPGGGGGAGGRGGGAGQPQLPNNTSAPWAAGYNP
jgi:hypothetical protein